MADKDKICDALLKANTVKFGEFTLASGKKSPIYIDMRVLPSYPAQFDVVTSEMARVVKELGADVVAGVESAGIPLSTAVALKNKMPMVYVRKKPKDYGTKSQIEGIMRHGDRVVLIDDLITDGGSKLEPVGALRDAGGRIENVVVILDREQGGEEILAQNGCKLHALVKIKKLLAYMLKNGAIGKSQYAQVLSYLDG